MPHLLRILMFLCLGWAAMCAPSAAHAQEDDSILVLGRISDDPSVHYEQLKPLLDYVIPRMASVGIREGRILMARDVQQMTSYLRRGRVDWVTETSGSAMMLENRAAAQPILLTERDGVSQYRSLIFVRRDSDIQTMAQLRGRTIAFQNTSSTSAYFVPASELLKLGESMEILLSPRDRPGPDSVGYVFARTESNIATWVHKRLVDAGALSNLDWANPAKVPESFRRDFRIIHESVDMPRAVEMVRSTMRAEVRDRLREVLMEAQQDPAAQAAMRRFFKTTKFLPLDAQTQKSLDTLRVGIAAVRSRVE